MTMLAVTWSSTSEYLSGSDMPASASRVSRRERITCRAALEAMRYAQVENFARGSNLPILRQMLVRAFCRASSASCRFPVVDRHTAHMRECASCMSCLKAR